MHNPWHTKPIRLLTGLGLLVCLLLSLGSGQALADSNVLCQGPGTGGTPAVIDLGNLQPGEQFQRDISAVCSTLKIFPYGVSIGQFQFNGQGSFTDLTVIHSASQKTIPLQSGGTAGTVCLPSTCTRLNAYADMSYTAIVVGQAKSANGSYSISLYLNYTMLGAVANNGDLQQVTFKYTVGQPSCTMTSDSYLSLPFGTMSTDYIGVAQQTASIGLNCPSYSRVNATLSSGQGITGTSGTSKTSLTDLLMVATWADTNTPVSFNSPRSIALSPGFNAINLGFRPIRLSPNSTPTGLFTATYTLTISYL